MPATDITIKEPFDLRTTLATMKHAKEAGIKLRVWDRDIKAVEDAIATIEAIREQGATKLVE